MKWIEMLLVMKTWQHNIKNSPKNFPVFFHCHCILGPASIVCIYIIFYHYRIIKQVISKANVRHAGLNFKWTNRFVILILLAQHKRDIQINKMSFYYDLFHKNIWYNIHFMVNDISSLIIGHSSWATEREYQYVTNVKKYPSFT